MNSLILAAALALSPAQVRTALSDLHVNLKTEQTFQGKDCAVSFSPEGFVEIEYTDGSYHHLENLLHLAQRATTGEANHDSWTVNESIDINYDQSKKILSFYNSYERLQDDHGHKPNEHRNERWTLQQVDSDHLQVKFQRTVCSEENSSRHREVDPDMAVSCTVKY